MSRARRVKRPQKGKRVLVFGESESDTLAIKELIKALCPGVVRVEVRRRPLVLIKNARPENIRSHADQVAHAVAVDNALAAVSCVFAHEDCDAVEPAHVATGARIEEALRGALRRHGITASVHAVVPAWEMENWWLLWPEEIAGLVQGWRVPPFAGREVGKTVNGKEALAKAVRPVARKGRRQGRGPREYRESDGPDIARAVREARVAHEPRGKSASYDRFRASVHECCSA